MGGISLLIVRGVLLDQWEEAAIAKMQRAAFQVDQQLMRPKRILMLYQEQPGDVFNRQVSNFLLDRLREMKSVTDVTLEWYGNGDQESRGNRQGNPMGSRRYHRMNTLEVSAPKYDADLQGETVSLVSEFHDEEGRKIGQIVVQISFYALIDDIVKSPWWKSNKAFLLDSEGNVLARTELFAGMEAPLGKYTFGSQSKLEKQTLEELQKNEFGTVLGEGMPPDEVSGYYRLREAAWTIVLIAPGNLALQPILKFRKYYFITGIIGIFLSLILITITTSKTARAIRKVSTAARQLAMGQFSEPLDETGQDEVAELTKNFNVMTRQLRERMALQQAMTVAREVQQNLLPQSSYRVRGLDISGLSLYCQETGGDYFDILPDKNEPNHVSVVLGDVVGHGIGAALLMASVRSLIRCRTSQPGSPIEIISDVNRLLCMDTEQSGNFVSLFYLEIEQDNEQIRWVRCGHDPALVYDPLQDEFSELRGDGLVLGFDSSWEYSDNSMMLKQESIMLIGSDGVWEAENEAGQQFGRDRLKKLIAANWRGSSEEIIAAITEGVLQFRGKKAQGDDITLVVVKAHQDRKGA